MDIIRISVHQPLPTIKTLCHVGLCLRLSTHMLFGLALRGNHRKPLRHFVFLLLPFKPTPETKKISYPYGSEFLGNLTPPKRALWCFAGFPFQKAARGPPPAPTRRPSPGGGAALGARSSLPAPRNSSPPPAANEEPRPKRGTVGDFRCLLAGPPFL